MLISTLFFMWWNWGMKWYQSHESPIGNSRFPKTSNANYGISADSGRIDTWKYLERESDGGTVCMHDGHRLPVERSRHAILRARNWALNAVRTCRRSVQVYGHFKVNSAQTEIKQEVTQVILRFFHEGRLGTTQDEACCTAMGFVAWFLQSLQMFFFSQNEFRLPGSSHNQCCWSCGELTRADTHTSWLQNGSRKMEGDNRFPKFKLIHGVEHLDARHGAVKWSCLSPSFELAPWEGWETGTPFDLGHVKSKNY